VAKWYLNSLFGAELLAAPSEPDGKPASAAGFNAGTVTFVPMGWLILTDSGKSFLNRLPPGARVAALPFAVPFLCVLSDVAGHAVAAWWDASSNKPVALDRAA
jgi:hypothetical protein